MLSLAVNSSPMTSQEAADRILGNVVADTQELTYLSQRDRRARYAALVTAYAMADPVLMFEPALHDVSLSNSGEYEQDYRERPKFARTITSRVLESRLQGCASLPMTLYPSTPMDLAPITRFLNLEHIQTVVECTSTAAVRPVYDPVTRSIKYQTFGADQFTPYVSGPERRLTALSVDWGTVREVWTADRYAITQGDSTLAEGVNPWGEIPFSILRTRCHPSSWWGVADLAAVALNNVAVNKTLSDLLQLAREQSFAIFVVYEDDQGGTQPAEFTDDHADQPTQRLDYNWTSGKTVYVPSNGKVETISPDADIKAISEVVEAMGKRAQEDSYLIDLMQSQAGQSGFALRTRMHPYLNKMRSVRREFGRGLEDLLHLARVVWFAGENGLPGARRRPDFSIRVLWDETPLVPVPVDEMVRRYEFEHRVGASSAADYLQETHGMTRAEAVARLELVTLDTEAGINGPGPTPETPAAGRAMEAADAASRTQVDVDGALLRPGEENPQE